MVKNPEIIVKGKDNGDGMVIYYRTSSGTDVFGLAVPNLRQFELGPTWCYLVCGESTTLIDTGRPHGLRDLEGLIRTAGKELADINRVIITHSHEDHDGNLPELLSRVKAELWAHSLYKVMITYFPEIGGVEHPDLPASCRNCIMPEKVYKDCIEYQGNRSRLEIDRVVDEDSGNGEFRFIHTPGHTADCICIMLEDEVIFTGDTVLPEITPHPSLAAYFETDSNIFPESCRDNNNLYGLLSYIKSLQKLAIITETRELLTLLAHKLYSYGKFNTILSCADRAREIIEFHIQRCDDIIRIVSQKSATVMEIVVQHFPQRQLRGYSKPLAEKEIMAHLEVLEETGDVYWTGTADKKMAGHTGSYNYREKLARYLLTPVI